LFVCLFESYFLSFILLFKCLLFLSQMIDQCLNSVTPTHVRMVAPVPSEETPTTVYVQKVSLEIIVLLVSG